MKFYYQFGYDLFFFIFWRDVPTRAFEKRIAPLLLQPGQFDTIRPAELLPFFNSNFVLRDGWRLYRGIPMTDFTKGTDYNE